MKRRLISVFLMSSFCLFLLSFFSPIRSMLGDTVYDSFQISASKLNIDISEFKSGVIKQDGTVTWHEINDSQDFGILMIQDDILMIEFVVKNNSPFDVVIEPVMELAFTKEKGERDLVLLYPETSDNANIRSNTGDGALIGFDSNDTNTISTPHGDLLGYKKNLNLDTLTTTDGEGRGFRAKRYTFKVHLSDLKFTPKELKDILKGNKLGIGVNVSAKAENQSIKWTDSDSVYGTIDTDIIIPSSLTIELLGDNPMYITQHQTFIDPGAHAYDEFGGNVGVTSTGVVNTARIGRYEITYSATHAGITKNVKRNVYVTDGEPPVITPISDAPRRPITTNLSLSSLVNVSDNVDSEALLRSNLVITTPPNYDSRVPGTYRICYNVTDSSGLAAIEKCLNLTIYSTMDVQLLFENTLVLTSDGHVYAAGYGRTGQTGVNSTSDQRSLVEISTLKDHNIIDLSGGIYFAMAQSDEGRVFIWGFAGAGVQGNGTTTKHNMVPVEVTGIGKIKQIDGDYYTALVLNEAGEVYTWGQGARYATGLGNTGNVLTPTKITFPNDAKIKYIEQGYYNGYAISEDNQLYSWGGSNYGLNLESTYTDSRWPVNVSDNLPNSLSVSDIKEIEAGEYHAYILTHDGLVYSWGANSHGQLGHNNYQSLTTPTLIQTFVSHNISIDHLVSGMRYGIAVDSDGVAYAWGESWDYAFSRNLYNPEPIKISENIDGKIVSMGAYYTHSALINDKGEVYVMGSNNFGKLGINSLYRQTDWVKVPLP